MKRVLSDFFRVMVLVVVAGYCLYLIDHTNIALLQGGLVAVFLAGGAYVVRRIMFHRLDLQTIAIRVLEENSAAGAIIFCAIVYFLVAVMDLALKVVK